MLKIMLKIMLLGSLLGSCAENESSPVALLAENGEGYLLFQAVDRDRYRLLFCAGSYVVGDMHSNCRNVYLDAYGKEFYFSGIPQKPFVFAPSAGLLRNAVILPLSVIAGVVAVNYLGKGFRRLQRMRSGQFAVYADLRRIENRWAAKQGIDVSKSAVAKIGAADSKFAGYFSHALTKGAKAGKNSIGIAEFRNLYDAEVDLVREQLLQLHATSPAVRRLLKKYDKSIRLDRQKFAEVATGTRLEASNALASLRWLWESNDAVLMRVISDKKSAHVPKEVLAGIQKKVAKARAKQVRKLKKYSYVESVNEEAGGAKPLALIAGVVSGAFLADNLPLPPKFGFSRKEWEALFSVDPSTTMRARDIKSVVVRLAHRLQKQKVEVVVNL